MANSSPEFASSSAKS